MRVCIAYDCLYPWTVGGHERYLTGLAEHLAAAGHEVTYITRRQWDEPPQVEGVEVVAVSRAEPLYDEAGRRRIGEAVRYGIGVGRHLIAHRGAYDVVHLVGFPYFSVPAARVALLASRTRIFVDWPEVWTREYWREYLGPVTGLVGYAIQRLCVALTPWAFVFSDLHGERLAAQGLRSAPIRLSGPVGWPIETDPAPAPPAPTVLFVGRMIPEKQVLLVPEAIALARRTVPELRGVVLGDGPDRAALLDRLDRLGLAEVVEAPGFVEAARVRQALRSASCLLAPSVREGFGLIALEAAAAGTPVVAVDAPDNAMVERIEDGVNGFVVPATPPALAEAIARVVGEPGLRRSTAAWFERTAAQLAPDAIARTVAAAYAGEPAGRRATM